ncbi:uncharacterized protein LOC143218310 [Lasioglossum baleicum]|uniref:uncharacterized protein LOC143218310 n=1 Tax=Lasioglossum baleicum TaxID=434251 RepID=UPI003FCD5DCC
MRTFAASLLLVFVASANAGVASLHKRGLGLEGSGHGSSQYLPPVSSSYEATGSISAFKPQTLSTSFVAPASTYGAPSFNAHVPTFQAPAYVAPAPTYSVPSAHSQIAFSTSYAAPSSTYGVPAVAPTYVAPAPAPAYVAPAPAYVAPAPAPHYAAPVAVSHGSFSRGLSFGHASVPSTSYGVPSTTYNLPHTVVEPAPAVLPETGHNFGLSLGSVDLSAGSASLGQDDGYSYPVPAKGLVL